MSLVRSNRRQLRTPFSSFNPTVAFPTMEDFENRMNTFVERAFAEPFSPALPEAIGWVPAVDIVESPAELTLTAELPGIDQKDVALSVEDGVLTLRGEKNVEHEQQDKKTYMYERNYGAFQRAFVLPTNIDPGKIAAEFDKGVLTVHLPKDGQARPRGRQIDIKRT